MEVAVRAAWLTVFMLATMAPVSAGRSEGAAGVQSRDEPAPVLFVCEHGNVKSLIAATLFDQLARERGLPFRAVSRGIRPEPGVPPAIVEALRSEGVDVAGFTPQPVTSLDLAHASRVVAIGVDLSALSRDTRHPIEGWSDVPPASVDYASARAALLRHIESLIDGLKKRR